MISLNNVIVYTDCSVRKNICCTIGILLTKETFITEIIKKYYRISNLDGEKLAILNALIFLEKNIKTTSIDIYTDDLSIILSYKNKNIDELEESILKSLLLKFSEFSKVYLHHIKAHSKNLNLNKVCDITARAYLNYSI